VYVEFVVFMFVMLFAIARMMNISAVAYIHHILWSKFFIINEG